MDVRLAPSGEAALRLTLDDADAETAWRTVHRIADWLNDRPIAGVFGAVPTYESMLVEFDADRQAFETLEPLLRRLVHEALSGEVEGGHAPRRFELPVVFGGEHGPDLGFVAEHLGMTPEEVVALCVADDRVVRCLGGPAASCMFDGPRFPRPVPRLADPRLEVPPSAVSLAGVQGVIGPVRAPSGWRLVGISPVAIMDITAPRLVPYRPGDVVRLRSIGADAWDDYAGVHMADLETAP